MPARAAPPTAPAAVNITLSAAVMPEGTADQFVEDFAISDHESVHSSALGSASSHRIQSLKDNIISLTAAVHGTLISINRNSTTDYYTINDEAPLTAKELTLLRGNETLQREVKVHRDLIYPLKASERLARQQITDTEHKLAVSENMLEAVEAEYAREASDKALAEMETLLAAALGRGADAAPAAPAAEDDAAQFSVRSDSQE
ncbi:hypothetical protein BJ878DRAFT_482920 [Calycina marina]|uniref:Uncharacterized protein n=1 Tax=Calycina marina TaxID=1763456 RepID=A0A9P7YYI6_9HELO|nr:hypothetical protein BJ878DRAFT_482920 [Calycina marina]